MPAHAGSNIIYGAIPNVKGYFRHFSNFFIKMAPRLGRQWVLAAAAGVVAAATGVVVGVGTHIVVAAAAEQDEQNNDPADVAAAEAIVTHRRYLQIVFSG
jgi:hypothetical protein